VLQAVRALVESTTNRTGVRFSLVVGRDLDLVVPDMAEDFYRIPAVHHRQNRRQGLIEEGC
jgi:hypothetical protein